MAAWSDNIRKVEPYVPGEQPQKKVIKLNTNENPYPPAPGVLAAMKKLEGHVDSLRLYPDPTSDTLVSALADFYHVGKDQVFVGVGSDDVLSMCFLTFFNSEKPVFFPDITYSFYKVWADLYRIPYECKKVDENFHIIKEDYYSENGGVIFPNPNAPTSIYEDLEFVEDIIRHNQDVIVIVDEAYIDFAGESALSLLDKYDNLIITQTFSKARSMAGMRIGYAIASPLLIKYLNDAKYSFNSYTMNKTSLVYGAEAVKDKEYEEMISYLCKHADAEEYVVTLIDGDRATDAHILGELFRKYTEQQRGNAVCIANSGEKNGILSRFSLPDRNDQRDYTGIFKRMWGGLIADA